MRQVSVLRRLSKAWRVVVEVGVVVGLVGGVVGLMQAFEVGPFRNSDRLNTVFTPGRDQTACSPARLPEPFGEVTVLGWMREPVGSCWLQTIPSLLPGSSVDLQIGYGNGSSTKHKDVVVRVNLPPGVVVRPNSTYLANSNNLTGRLVTSNNIATTGIVIGSYGPGAAGYVKVTLSMPFESDLACGHTEIKTVVVVRPESMNEFYNTVVAGLDKRC